MGDVATESAAQTNKPVDGALSNEVPMYADMSVDQGDTDAGNATGQPEPTSTAPEVKPDDKPTTIEPIAPDPVIEPVVAEGAGEKTGGDEVVYKDFKLPEGQSMDKAALDAFIPLAKKYKLPQEAAQGVIDIASGMISRNVEAQELLITNQEKSWKTEILQDPEIGGAKQVEAAAYGQRALNRFDIDGKFAEVLEVGRLKYNPAIRRFLARVGGAVSEDTLVQGQPAPKSSSGSNMYSKSGHK